MGPARLDSLARGSHLVAAKRSAGLGFLCWPATRPPTPPSTTRTAWPACWTACGEVGAHEQAAALTDRLSAAGMFVLFLEQNDPADQFRFGRRADGITEPRCLSPDSRADGRQHETDEMNGTTLTPNRSSQFFEAQRAGGVDEEIN
jgi:hypothetical protein